MIGDVTRAIVRALQNARQGTPFETTEIRPDAGAPEPSPAGVTVNLAGVAMDHAARNVPARVGAKPVDPGIILHYIITPWADNAPEQHDTLGWILRTVHSGPVITAAGGTIRLSVATLTLEAEARLWRALHPGRPMLPSLHIEARAALAGSPAIP